MNISERRPVPGAARRQWWPAAGAGGVPGSGPAVLVGSGGSGQPEVVVGMDYEGPLVGLARPTAVLGLAWR